MAKLKEHFADESIYPLALHFHWTSEEDNKLVEIYNVFVSKYLKLHVEVISGPTDRLSGVDARDIHK